MKVHSFKVHSMVDVITNSSTTIYTYSGGSVQPAKEMIDEFLKVFGSDLKCDDVFAIDTFLDSYEYSDYEFEEDETDPFADLDWKGTKVCVEQIISDILLGNIERPQWMKDVEQHKSDDYDSGHSTDLHIIAKKPEFEHLAEKIVKFLYSTESDASYDG